MSNPERLPNRLRPLLLERGAASYLVDAPSDMPELTDRFRAGRAHAQDLGAVLDDAARRFPGRPVILVGHSNGTQSAAHVAAGGRDGVRGVVLIAGRFAAIDYDDRYFDGAGLSRFDWSRIAAPVLIIHHRKDDCFATPYEAAESVARRNPSFGFLAVDPPGATAHGRCTLAGPHNMVGLEAVIADALAGWAPRGADLDTRRP